MSGTSEREPPGVDRLEDMTSTFSSAATAELDDSMQQCGSSPGQVGMGADGSQSVLYCISVEALAERWPDVHTYLRRRMGIEVCADLTLGVSGANAWERADLESLPLSEVVHAVVGHPAPEHAIARLREDGHNDGLAWIRRACERLFPPATP